jgi:Heat induced stress protein YflT
MMNRRDIAVGLFSDPERARDAIDALKAAGFKGDDISLLMHDRSQAHQMADETGTKAGEAAATGAVTGGILGGLGGWLVGVGALAIPAVGPFIAAGAFATALGGAVLGAGVGAIAGALVGMGIPEEEAAYYEQEVRGGRTLVTVQAGSRLDEADDLLHRFGAYDVQHRDEPAADPGASLPASGTAPIDSSPVTRSMEDQPARWQDYAPQYRSRWEQMAASAGGTWADVEPCYQYGWQARNDSRYHDRTWTDAEPDLRRDWESRHADRPWDQARENVRDAWEHATGSGSTSHSTFQQTR